MFSYFRGWKRKAGLVTLAMACIATCFWVRSDRIAETFTLPYQAGRYMLIAFADRNINLALFSIIGKDDETKLKPYFWMSDTGDPLRTIPSVANTPSKGIRRLVDFGDAAYWAPFELRQFSVYSIQPKIPPALGGKYQVRFNCLTIPCWLLLLPLTLLSAYLLLSKPRQKPSVPLQDGHQ